MNMLFKKNTNKQSVNETDVNEADVNRESLRALTKENKRLLQENQRLLQENQRLKDSIEATEKTRNEYLELINKLKLLKQEYENKLDDFDEVTKEYRRYLNENCLKK